MGCLPYQWAERTSRDTAATASTDGDWGLPLDKKPSSRVQDGHTSCKPDELLCITIRAVKGEDPFVQNEGSCYTEWVESHRQCWTSPLTFWMYKMPQSIQRTSRAFGEMSWTSQKVIARFQKFLVKHSDLLPKKSIDGSDIDHTMNLLSMKYSNWSWNGKANWWF